MFTQEKILQMQIEEHIDPGEVADLYLSLDREVSAEEEQRVQTYLRQQGMSDARVEFGATPACDNVLRIRFTRAGRGVDTSVLPLFSIPLIIIGGLATIGIVAFAGVAVARSITKNLLPLALIAAGTTLGFVYLTNRR